MTWTGVDRRSRVERRVVERRRVMRYNIHTLIIVEGITWVDGRDTDRRIQIRRREDRERLARKVEEVTRP